MAGKLTEKQRLFVVAFLGEAQGNGTKAAQLAGVPRQSAATMAWKWLRKVQVQKALVQRREKKETIALLTQDRRETLMSGWAEDEQLDMKHRTKAMDMLNRCAGAYSMTHILKGRVGIATVIARSRRPRPQASK